MAYHIFKAEAYEGETLCGIKVTNEEHYDSMYHNECKVCQAVHLKLAGFEDGFAFGDISKPQRGKAQSRSYKLLKERKDKANA